MGHQELIEIAWGLGNSKKPCLWIVGPDLVNGEAAELKVEA